MNVDLKAQERIQELEAELEAMTQREILLLEALEERDAQVAALKGELVKKRADSTHTLQGVA